MRSSSGAVEPMIASVDSAAVTTAVAAFRQAPQRPVSAQAVENCVPLMRASPSLAPSTMAARPARPRASPPGRSSPATIARPSPIITAAICASGARSPDAPTDP